MHMLLYLVPDRGHLKKNSLSNTFLGMIKLIKNPLFIFLCACILLGGDVVYRLSASEARASHVEALHRHMLHQASVVSRAIAQMEPQGLVAYNEELKSMKGIRTTLVVKDDASLPLSSPGIEQLLARPEVQQARITGKAYSVRTDPALDVEVLYTAVRVDDERSPVSYLLFSEPLHDLSKSTLKLRLIAAAVTLALLLATAGVFYRQSIQIGRGNAQLRDFLERLGRAEIPGKVTLTEGPIAALEGDLNRTAEKIKEVFKQKQVEHRRLDAILKNIPDALIIVDPKDSVVFTNQAADKLLAASGFLGRQVYELIRIPTFSSLMERAKASQQVESAEFSIDEPKARSLDVKVSPLFIDDANMAGLIVILNDISELKRLESARKDFVANISHEIKTPIASIRGFAETLLEGEPEDKDTLKRFLTIIKSNSERINRIVDDLLTISRLELGAIKVTKREVSLKETCESVITMLEAKSRAKGISLNIKLDDKIKLINADSDRLVQVLTNLIDNAIKFTEAGSVTVGTMWEGERPCLFVSDTGVGIPQTNLPRIGERFYRVDASRSREMGGTGLGLAIVKHIVLVHGWIMDIQSTVGRGTTVRIMLK